MFLSARMLPEPSPRWALSSSSLLFSGNRRSQKARLSTHRPLTPEILHVPKRPADLPAVVTLPRPIAARAMLIVHDWVRRHPSSLLRDWMALSRLKIQIVPGFPTSKGKDFGVYEESRNRVRLCPVLLKDEKTTRRVSRSQLEQVMAHEIEGHFVEALPALLDGRVRLLPRRLYKQYVAQRPGLAAKVEAILDEYKGGSLAEHPRVLHLYRQERANVPQEEIQKTGIHLRDWKYVSGLHELIAYCAQFDAACRDSDRKHRKRGHTSTSKDDTPKRIQWTDVWTGDDTFENAMMMATAFYPNTIAEIRHRQQDLLTL